MAGAFSVEGATESLPGCVGVEDEDTNSLDDDLVDRCWISICNDDDIGSILLRRRPICDRGDNLGGGVIIEEGKGENSKPRHDEKDTDAVNNANIETRKIEDVDMFFCCLLFLLCIL